MDCKGVTKRNQGVWIIAQTQKITKQHAYRVYKKYKYVEEPKLFSCEVDRKVDFSNS